VRELRDRLQTIVALERAGSVLEWDQETYMPEAGGAARADQLARLARVAHEMFIAPETGALLQNAAAATDHPGSIDADLLRVTQRDYERARRIPAPLVAELHRHSSLAYPVWVHARGENDFTAFVPILERSFELARELAEHVGYRERPYDALLDEYEPGMTTSQVDAVFTELKSALLPMAEAIRERASSDEDAVLRGSFDVTGQEQIGLRMIERFGFDLGRGRLDQVVHPFASAFSRDDVRITTRYDCAYLVDALFSTLHESGHGMYEQGVDPELEGTPLATGASSALHESQSRLWENVVGRSRAVWEYFYPGLQRTFPRQFANVSLDTFYRAINRVSPSFVRVDADEVTYNLHIMLRYEMEQGLLSGEIPAREAASVWNDKMEEYLGIRPPSDTLGILQDTHWASGLVGYFPTYTLGNVLSVQFFDAAIRDHPEIEAELAAGEFGTLRRWLIDHLYSWGRRLEPNDLIQRATGGPMTAAPYLDYLRTKFGSLYGLTLTPPA
jgi:carboxypeptidase Taq